MCIAPKLVEVKSKQSLSLANRFKFACYLTEGSKPVQFKWFKDDAPLLSVNDQTYRIETNQDESVLTIFSLIARDEGNYSCHVQNRFGVGTQFTWLTIKGSNNSTVFLFLNFLFVSMCGALVTVNSSVI